MRVLKRKQQDMLTRSITGLERPIAEPLFPIVLGDNNLKKNKRLLESNAPKKTNWSIKQQSIFTYRYFKMAAIPLEYVKVVIGGYAIGVPWVTLGS